MHIFSRKLFEHLASNSSQVDRLGDKISPGYPGKLQKTFDILIHSFRRAHDPFEVACCCFGQDAGMIFLNNRTVTFYRS